jgi:uncharacterized protein
MARLRPIITVALAVTMVCLFALAALAQPRFPALTGRIVDEAGLLSGAQRAQIEADLKVLEGKSSDQLVIYTTKSLQGYPIEDFGYQLGRAWKIGQAGGNNGVVLIVAPNDRKVRIEVGRGLEGQMTDLMSKIIIDNAILPAFRRGDFAGGIVAGVRDIKDVLLGDAAAVKERAKWGQKRSDQSDPLSLVLPLMFILVFAFILWSNAQAARRLPPSAQRRRRQGDGNVIVIPGGWGSSGGWGGSSGGSSSGDSGGGFSGGGGDFGGGGSSGSW